MRILGIDPGLYTTGYGLIEGTGIHVRLLEAGFIRTPKEDRIEARLDCLSNSLNKLLNNTSPEILVLEKLYSHWKHPATAFILGHARGVICLAARANKIPMIEYPATRVKKSIAGNGHASKEQMQNMIMHILSLKELPKPNDVADAMSLAVSHSYMAQAKAAPITI